MDSFVKKQLLKLAVIGLFTVFLFGIFWSRGEVFAINSVSIEPTEATLLPGDSTGFTATTNDPLGVTFSLGSDEEGTIEPTSTTTVTYTAPAIPDTYAIVATTNSPGEKNTAQANIHVSNQNPYIFVTVDQGDEIYHSITVSIGASTTLTVTTNDLSGVTWAIYDDDGNEGTIDPITGVYTAPMIPGEYEIDATSNTDGENIYGWVTIIVTDAPAPEVLVTVSPSTTYLTALILDSSQTQQFTANVVGSESGVVWSASTGAGYFFCAFSCPPSAGSINQNGLYTASIYNGTYAVIATSVDDPTKSDVAFVTVRHGASSIPPALSHSSGSATPAISISPASISVESGDSFEFTAILNSGNTTVSWSVLEGLSGGAISQLGKYVAPVTLGTYHVVVASAYGTAQATVTVVPSTKIATSTVTVPLPLEEPAVKPSAEKSGLGAGITGVGVIAPLSASSTSTTTSVVIEPPTPTPSLIAQVTAGVTLVAEQVSKAADATVSAIQTPAGSVVVNSVSTVGAVAGVSSWTLASLLASPIFANPITASEILFVPFRLWGLVLSALGLKRRNRPWGTVYDSVTKMPIDPAVVTLHDESGKKVASSITDLDGRFGFIVPKGTYHLHVQKTNYSFPSKKLSERSDDELYSNLYFGEKIEVAEDGSVIYKNIPMDPEHFDWNEFTKNKMGVMQFHSASERFNLKASNLIFWFGSVVALVSVFVIPHVYSITILSLYVILIALRFLGVHRKVFGTITDGGNHPLSFATISVFSKDLHRELFKKVADQYGHYYALVPKGEYEIKVSRKNPDESYTPVYTSEVNAKEGVINEAIRV